MLIFYSGDALSIGRGCYAVRHGLTVFKGGTADSWCSRKMYLLVRVMLSVMAVLLFEGDRSGYAVRHGCTVV